MPKIRTHKVNYHVTPNMFTLDVDIYYDTKVGIFYVIPPVDFKGALNTFTDEMKDKFKIADAGYRIRGVRGNIIQSEKESDLVEILKPLFTECASSVKSVKNVLLVWSKGESSLTKRHQLGSNKECTEIKQSFRFIRAVETKIGSGHPVYTYQNVSYTNTVTWYADDPVIIDDTEENRFFMENVYAKFDDLILKLLEFFKSSENILQLISSNQKLI